MEPEIEIWLEDALENVMPTIPGVSRVSLEPDYESGLTPDVVPEVKTQLLELLGQVHTNSSDLVTHEGQVLTLQDFPALRRYTRKISLHGGEKADKPWIDVTPAGNWI
jgi:hypothetical protein